MSWLAEDRLHKIWSGPRRIEVTAVPLRGDLLVAARADEVFNNFASGVGDIVTALAVLVGGLWAYFKFVRGRTYKPRLSVHMAAQWRNLEGVGDALHVRIRVTNIGASKVSLNQHGTGLVVAFPADVQHVAPDDVAWSPVVLPGGNECWFEIFTEHAWVEPNETVSDDLLLDFDRTPMIAKLEANLVWAESDTRNREPDNRFRASDVAVFARVIVPPDSTIKEPAS
jgi:hypothetical protein